MTSDRECLWEKIPEWLCAIETEKISNQGEDLWTVICCCSNILTRDRECLQEKIPEWLQAIEMEKISNRGEDLWTGIRRRSIVLMYCGEPYP